MGSKLYPSLTSRIFFSIYVISIDQFVVKDAFQIHRLDRIDLSNDWFRFILPFP